MEDIYLLCTPSPAMKTAPGIDLAHEVIESIVTLTEQRDQRSLEQSLLATLHEMLAQVEGWLLDLPGAATGPDDCNLLHGNEDTLPGEILKRGCALPGSDSMQLAELAGRAYLIAKLQDAERGHVHLLILAQERWAEIDLLLVKGMIRVYQNFIGLLYDSEKDTLTGLYNRRKLELKLKEFDLLHHPGRRARDKDHADYLVIMDLDRFKQINDRHGHLIGDEVLLVFANILRRTLRDSDLVFRYGGEEFIALLQNAPRASIADVLERVRRNVEEYDFPLVGRVTVSMGYSTLDGSTSPLDVLEKADRALYFAKDNGRNQVREFEQLVNQHLLEDVHRDGSVELF
jgi:diguanylate cyclase (GGDEF)-like protein